MRKRLLSLAVVGALRWLLQTHLHLGKTWEILRFKKVCEISYILLAWELPIGAQIGGRIEGGLLGITQGCYWNSLEAIGLNYWI